MNSHNKQYANEILDDIECYRAVLDRRLKQFPTGFWTRPWSLESASVLTRYLIEEKFKFTEEDIRIKVNAKMFMDNKLKSLLRIFDESVYKVINNAYPNKFKPWEIGKVPRGFWEDKNHIVEATRWLVETKLDNNRERVCREFTVDFLTKHNLTTLVRYGIHPLLEWAYPNEFTPWEVGVVPKGFWANEYNKKQAVRWLIETKLDNNRDRVCKELTKEFMSTYGLTTISNYGVHNILNMAYPNEYKPWELAGIKKGFWQNDNNIREVVRWVVETQLGNDKERVKREFRKDLLIKLGLRELVMLGLYRVIDMTYPNEFKQKDFHSKKTVIA